MRLAMGGAETLDARLEFGVSSGEVTLGFTGTVVFDTTIKRSGAASFKANSGANNSSSVIRSAGVTPNDRWQYNRCYFYITALPTSDLQIISELVAVSLTSAGKIKTSNGQLSTNTVSLNTWFCVEQAIRNDTTTGTRRHKVRLDGTDVGTEYTTTAGALTDRTSYGVCNTATGTFTLYWDDYATNDDQGSLNNTWVGTAEKMLLVMAASDEAVGSNWKLGGGGTPSGNAYDTVNNLPPLGVGADAAGNTTGQIQNTVSDASTAAANCADFRCQSYSAAGVDTGSTVTAVRPVTAFGDPFAATTYTGAQAVVTNPSIGTEATIATSAGAAATYPSGWRTPTIGTQGPTYDVSSQPTLSQGPVVRVRKATATPNRILVCAAGVYFGYIPPAPANKFMATA
jgi:hypothetical protein